MRLRRSFIARSLAGGLVLLAADGGSLDAKAGHAPEYASLFPQAAGAPIPDRREVAFKIQGLGQVHVSAVRFAPKPGLSQAAVTTWCGLVVKERSAPAKSFVTIGMASTETLSCDGLAEIGDVSSPVVPARLGLVYRTRSANAVSLTPLVILRNASTGAWEINQSSSEAISQLRGKASLKLIRRFLAKH